MPSQIISSALQSGRTVLTEIESKQLLAEVGIPVVETKLAKTKEQAISMSKEMGYPVALKIVSPDIIHKSDAGGVKLGLENATQVGKAFSEIMAAAKSVDPKAKIHGVSVQKMARPGVEVIMGMSKDNQFGPVLMFGLGGVFVEILEDVAFRIVPLLKRDASQMIREIKGFPLLEGYRGQEPANIATLENMLLQLSDFLDKTPEIKELDLNPIMAYKDGALAVDARVILESNSDNPTAGSAAASASKKNLDRLFNPSSVAVIGDKMALGYMWLKSLSPFKGKVYSVQTDPNEFPGIAELGVDNYKSLNDIPDPVDYVLAAVPRTVAPIIVNDCIKKDVGGVCFFTAGFAETNTEDGVMLQQVITDMARGANLNIVGPNCMGIYDPQIGLRQMVEQEYGETGPVGFISQSGTHATIFSSVGARNGIRISRSVSYGNAIVLDSPDYLEYLGADERTKIIGMYIEGVKDGRKFFNCLRDVASRKPVLIWKGGQTEEGARATASHTASLAESGIIWQTVINQCGAIKVDSLDEMVDTMKGLLYIKPSTGNRVGLIAMTGGQSVVITDTFAKAGLQVPLLSEDSYQKLGEFFNIIGGSYRNPLDIGSTFLMAPDNISSLTKMMNILNDDPNVDCVVLELLPAFLTMGMDPDGVNHILDAIAEFKEKSAKPFLVVVTNSHSDAQEMETRNKLMEWKIPSFTGFQRGAETLQRLVKYYHFHNQ
ncbi:MAG: acetate--CoA ligase family protein [Chloroflexota bacterium]|nr:acetate--CoA ligase family protein [Chloroflexota bacterium]